MKNLIALYGNLRREMYVLVFGRLVTTMGGTIWPMLTLILSNKMQMSASEIARLMLILGIFQVPSTLLGGKLADRFNKRNVIIVCDFITVACYCVCGFIGISSWFLFFFCAGSIASSMEYPSYDALVADLTRSEDRERAYSLNYLAANLGIVVSPIIGGVLFENHLNLAFFITAAATFSSTILIFFFIRNTTREESKTVAGNYEKGDAKSSVFQVLKDRKILIFFALCGGMSSLVYSQFNFLIPLNLEMLYGAKSAIYFGSLTSLNAFTCFVATPLFTTWFSRLHGTSKIVLGESLIAVSFIMYIFFQDLLPMYYVSMVVFTLGEVFTTLGKQPYLTRRIPSTHRGRVSSISNIFSGGFSTIAQTQVGRLVDFLPIRTVWAIISGLAVVATGMYSVLGIWDKKEFPLLATNQVATVDDIPSQNSEAQ